MFKNSITYTILTLAFTTWLFAPASLFAQLTATISTSKNTVCEAPNPSVTFTGIATGGTGPYTYSWNFGSGQGNSNFNPATWFFTGPGTYTVTLTVTDANSSTAQATTPTTVFSLPTVSFTADNNEGCDPFTANFTSTVTGGAGSYTYLWNFGDGNSSALPNPTHPFNPPPTTWTIFLLVTDGEGCTQNLTQTDLISVNLLPTANFSSVGDGGSGIGCNPPSDIQFTDSSTPAPPGTSPIISWAWDFDDGSGIDFTQNPLHTYNTQGIYNVTLTVTDDKGCQDSITISVTIDDFQTSFAASTDTTICKNLTVSFTDQTSSLFTVNSWQWTFPGGNPGTSTSQNPLNIQYSTPDTFDVYFVSSNGFCSDSDTIFDYIVIHPLPEIGFIIDSMLDTIMFVVDTTMMPLVSCEVPLFVTFSDTSGSDTTAPIKTWVWDIDGDGSTDYTDSSFTHTYTTTGFYDVTLTVTDTNNCDTTQSINSMIRIALPIAGFEADTSDFTAYITEGCIPLRVNFRDTSVYDTTGLGLVPGDSIVAWWWDFGDGDTIFGGDSLIPDSTQNCLTTCTYRNPTHYYIDTGTFTVKLVVFTANGCFSDTMVMSGLITPGVPPMLEFAALDTIGCHPFDAEFADQSSTYADTWYWEFGDGGNSTAQDPTYTYNQDVGFFQVLMFASFNSCPADTLYKDSMILVQTAKPLFVVTPTILCLEDTLPTGGWQVTITDSSQGPDIWIWNLGDTAASTFETIDTLIKFAQDTLFVPADSAMYVTDTIFFRAGDAVTCDTIFEFVRISDTIIRPDTIVDPIADTLYFPIKGDFIQKLGLPKDTVVNIQDSLIILYQDTVILNSDTIFTTYNYIIVPKSDTIIDTIYTIFTSGKFNVIYTINDTSYILIDPSFIVNDSLIFGYNLPQTLYRLYNINTLPGDTIGTRDTIVTRDSTDLQYYIPSYDTVYAIGATIVYISYDTLFLTDTTVSYLSIDTVFFIADTTIVARDTMFFSSLDTIAFISGDSLITGRNSVS